MSLDIEHVPALQDADPQTEEREAKRIDARARRAAKRVGWIATKTRWRAGSIDNYGGFAIYDPHSNFIVYGEKFDLTAEDVIEYCTPDTED